MASSFHFSVLCVPGARLNRDRRTRGAIRCSSERQALFGRIAPVYDDVLIHILNDLLSLGQHRIWKRMAVSWSGAKLGDCVLDLCCGSGDLAFLLSEKVGPHGRLCATRSVAKAFCKRVSKSKLRRMVTGLDFSKEQLSVASSRQRLQAKACYKNIEWVQGNALELPFPGSYFDAITIGYGLRNVVDKPKAMREMYRVVKPGCRICVLDFNKSTQPLTISFQEWMIDNIVVPVATRYGLGKDYEYLKSSISEFLTGKELEKLALESGFSSGKHYEISGGLMGILVVTR